MSTEEHELAQRLLNVLNDGKVCRKCGATDDASIAKFGNYSHRTNQIEGKHGVEYNAASDTLKVTCWRCGFQWSREPFDKKEAE